MNRSIMAQRAATRKPRANTEPVSRNLALRVEREPAATGNLRNRKSPRMTATQRDSHGQRSDWAKTPYFRTAATHDIRWSQTMSTHDLGWNA